MLRTRNILRYRKMFRSNTTDFTQTYYISLDQKLNVVSEYHSFEVIRKGIFEKNSTKVEKMPVFCKSKRENEKTAMTNAHFFEDWHVLWQNFFSD